MEGSGGAETTNTSQAFSEAADVVWADQSGRGNSGFVAVLHDGLTDGAAARGKATDMTWPAGAVMPPFVRIDHVLTGARRACSAFCLQISAAVRTTRRPA